MEYAERMWRGETTVGELLRAGSLPLDVAFEIVDDVAFVFGFANVIAFRTEESLLLFDTGTEPTARLAHRAVRRWCAHPLRYAIYSHGHIDHVFGVGPFDAEAAERGWERPVVIAHEAVRDRFDRYAMTSGYNEIVNRRQFGDASLRWPRDYRYPDRTYRDHDTVRSGGLTLELHHARGETDDHTWAYVPERDIVLPGDLFIWNSPNCGNPQKVQRYPADWAAALRAMAGVGASTLIPSHGLPIVGADRVRTALTDVAEYLESLLGQTLDLMNRGARLDEIIHAVRPPGHLAAKPYLRAAYDEPEFVVRNIWRLYGGWWDGDPASLKPARAERLAAVLAELAGGPGELGGRALRALADDEPRVAAHLAELALSAAPSDEGVKKIHRQVFTALADEATSTMARGIYRAAADTCPPT